MGVRCTASSLSPHNIAESVINNNVEMPSNNNNLLTVLCDGRDFFQIQFIFILCIGLALFSKISSLASACTVQSDECTVQWSTLQWTSSFLS